MHIFKLFIIILVFMYPQVAFSDLTYSVLRVDETYDGRSKGDDFTGAWIKIVNVKSNGSQHILPILQFEIAGNYGTTVDTLGFMSGKTVTKIDPKIASKVDEWGGKKHYRVYVYQSLEEGNLRRFLTSLKPEDQETIKAICGSLSDKEFVRGLIPKMISANRFGEKYKKYWSNKSRVTEIVSHAKECNRGLGQSNSNASKFVLVNKDDINKPELCGFSLHSDFKFGRAEKISAQSTLNKLGHYQGSIDGDFGKNSCKALKSYLSSRLIQIDNNKILKSHIDPLINKAKKKISPPTIPLSKLARSEQYGVTNNETVDNSNGEEEIQKDVSAYNRLSLENASMLKAIGDKENLITQLQTQIKSIKKTVKSSQDESAGLKALASEQKKLTKVLKERIIAIEAASILLKTNSLQAEQKALRQATKIDGLQATIIELKNNIVSLEKQKKSLEISELETSKQIEILRDDQATLQKTKKELISSNETLILENGSLSTKLQKLGSKSLFEGGLSGNSQGSTNSKKDDLSLVSNSLGGNLISKQLIKNLQDENVEFRRAKIENLDKIEALKIQVQTALIQLATTKSSINELKKETTKQSTKITNLQDELIESKTKTQSKVIELVSLKAQLAELQSYKAQMANKKSQEIETSKIALKALFENKKALILSSASGEAEVKDYISNLIERLGLSPEADTFDIFLASDKSFSITLGLGTQAECNSMRDQLLAFGSIPEESFCSDWNEYIAAFDFKNGQLFATVGQNYFENEETSNKVISTNKPNTSKTKSPENKQPGAVEETQTATKIQDNSSQKKASQSELDIFDTEIPSKSNIITKGTPINSEAAKKTKFLNENFPAGKKYVYFTDGSCKPKTGSICIDQKRAKFACDNLEKLGPTGMYPSQERLLAQNVATFRFGAEKQFIESASSSNGIFLWTSNFAETFEACYAQTTLTGMMNGGSKVMNIQGRACTFERKKDRNGKEYFSVEYFCS